ncbi:MFS transporter [Nocardia tenerifensis]
MAQGRSLCPSTTGVSRRTALARSKNEVVITLLYTTWWYARVILVSNRRHEPVRIGRKAFVSPGFRVGEVIGGVERGETCSCHENIGASANPDLFLRILVTDFAPDTTAPNRKILCNLLTKPRPYGILIGVGVLARSGSGARSFRLLWIGILFNRLGMPTPPFLLLYASVTQLGNQVGTVAVVAASGVGQTVASLAGGVLADRYGPRRTIGYSQAVGVLACAALPAVQGVAAVTALVLLSTACASVPRPAANALVPALMPPDARVAGYGRLYWSRNIGSSLSPLVAGPLVQFWPPGIFVLGAVTSALFTVLATTLPEVSGPENPRGAGILRGIRAPYAEPVVAWFLVASLILSCLYMQKQGALPLDMTDRGLTPTELGLVLSLSGVLVVVLQPVITPAVTGMSFASAAATSAALIALGLGTTGFATNAWWFAITVIVWTVGEIMQVPLAADFMAARAPDGKVGAYQGAYGFMWNLGLAVGAPIGQLMFVSAGRAVVWTVVAALGVSVALGHLAVFRR